MTLKNNRAPLLCYFKLCASFHSHWWIRTGVTFRKRLIWVKIDDFLAVSPCSLTDDLEKQTGTPSMLLQALCIIWQPLVNSNWSYSPEMSNLGQIRQFLEPCDLAIWRMILNKANLRDLIAATGLVILLKLDWNRRFFSPCDLEIWWMTPKNNRAPLLCNFKLFAAFCSHWWIQTGVRVPKCLIWVKIDIFFSRVTLKFDGWP